MGLLKDMFSVATPADRAPYADYLKACTDEAFKLTATQLKMQMEEAEAEIYKRNHYGAALGNQAIAGAAGRSQFDLSPQQMAALQRQVHTQAQAQQSKEDIFTRERARRAELLASPAYALTLTAATDLWFAKYGDAWVSRESLEDTPVEGVDWKVLAERLAHEGRLENPPNLNAYRTIE